MSRFPQVRRYADAASMARNAKDLQAVSERELAGLAQEWGIRLESRPGFTLAAGREDAAHQRIVIAYAAPQEPMEQAAARLQTRLEDLAAGAGRPRQAFAGAVLDGRQAIFVRFQGEEWRTTAPRELARCCDTLLRMLFHLSVPGKALTPEALARDFGPASSVARPALAALGSSAPPEAFENWRTLFAQPGDIQLFALHTYYALVVQGLSRLLAGRTETFPFFAWGASVAGEDIATALARYNPGTLLENRDLLRELYQQLFPRALRHERGEYYTPAWLAAHVFDELGYQGGADQRILDPACGSGTFLVAAIDRIREAGPEEGLLQRILANVVGFDINPLAVLAARLNYQAAIRDLTAEPVEVPVYLCDSVLTPAEHGSLFTGGATVAKIPCPAARTHFLLVPREIAADARHVEVYAALLRRSLDTEQFLEACLAEGLPVTDRERHAELHREFELLRHAGQDELWAGLLRDACAPVFCGEFDFVAGNPPWVNWEHLSPEYRELTEPLWREYQLAGTPPPKRRQSSGQSKTDLSVLMTYVACDKLLRGNGRLGFVISRSLFQAELGGRQFRRFQLPDGRPFSVDQVFDLAALDPFQGEAANASCTFFATRDRRTSFPVPWRRCLPEARWKMTVRDWIAAPVDRLDPLSPWLFGEREAIASVSGLLGRSEYADSAREGVNTRGGNGVYFLSAEQRAGRLLVRNRKAEGDDAAIPEVEWEIEPDYVYPLLRGRDVRPWAAEPAGYILVPHAPLHPSQPAPFEALPPRTREFLSVFREKLGARKSFRSFHPAGGAWHGLYSVLGATFAPFKVVWREMAEGIVAAVVSSARMPGGEPKVVVPDHKLFVIPCGCEDEALFVCGFLSSSLAGFIVRSYALSTGISTHVLERIPLPRFSSESTSHEALVLAAAECRESAGEAERQRLDWAVARCAGLSKPQMEQIRKALADLA